ncbi:hypothetical protein [Paraburkholderia humisilvae]|uniref:Uncharacterized protein n=1 Tax=Paraburkholderia humisilvae TaxID=627669 RepID=A0A6J5DMS4_9BURK|nr:hypothetical protein [Paraburkholderia humisilvae]CAB3755499.1 hypothetical protein LMG29542_02609 [Paraburkholderia humisilvae]
MLKFSIPWLEGRAENTNLSMAHARTSAHYADAIEIKPQGGLR